MKYTKIIILFLFLIISPKLYSNNPAMMNFAIAKYSGGDWYGAIKSIENFINNLRTKLNFSVSDELHEVSLDSSDLYNYPLIFLNGHGEILLNRHEKNGLIKYLKHGGTLIVNDDYGLDKHFRSLIKELFPENELVELPKTHEVFSTFYLFKEGIPKIHEHDGEPASLWGLYLNNRLCIFYIYSSDIIDGWDKYEVHKDPKSLRDLAFQFGVNLLYYILLK